jgi:hypothetical protein
MDVELKREIAVICQPLSSGMAEPPGAASAQRITRAAFKAWLDGKSPSIRSSPRATSLRVGKPETDSEDDSYSGVSGSAGPDDENLLSLHSQPLRTPAPASIDQHGSAVPRKAAVGTSNPAMRPSNAGKTPMAAQGTNSPHQHSNAGPRKAAGVAPNPVSHSPSNSKYPLAAQGVRMPTYASKSPMAPQRANYTDQQAILGPGKDAGGMPSQAVDAPFHIFNGQDDGAHSGGGTHEVHLHLPSFAWSVLT